MSSVLKKTNVLEGKEKAKAYKSFSVFEKGYCMMIDTVQLRHRIAMPTPSELLAQGWTSIIRHGDTRWILNPPADIEILPRLTWRQTPSGAWLTIEVSLPKLLYSNNIVLLSDTDIRRGLEQISQYASNVIGMRFDAATALVGRVDYYFNFKVGEFNIAPYILLASSVCISRMTRFVIGETTVSWANKSKRRKTKEIKIYGKHAEVAQRLLDDKATEAELQAANGLLRLEISHRTPDSVRRLTRRYGLQYRTAYNLLSTKIALDELGRTLKLLNLDRMSPATDDRLEILRQHFGDTKRFRNLAAFIALLDRYGEDFWKQGIGGYSRSSAYRYSRDLKQAGAGLKSACKLPPLLLPNLHQLPFRGKDSISL